MLIFFVPVILASCSKINKFESLNSKKDYIEAIIIHEFKEVDSNKFTWDAYLKRSKPFAIWDARPLEYAEVTIDG